MGDLFGAIDRPTVIYRDTPELDGEWALTCPVCGMEGDWDDFDAGGADPGCVFCNGCNVELHT